MGYYRDLYDDLKYEMNELKNKIKKSGYEKAKKTRLLNKIKKKIDWLESHNKNLTKQQYFLILEIKDLLK
jgi:hypothetical protein